ncbi:MAG: DUF192 domain-containing protein [Anaerolineales bacterium]|jgi:uncharacterized membrane protein (UPF0127 family)
MKNVIVVNKTHSLESALQASYCFSFFCRLKGLTFRWHIPKDWGLLLVQSKDSRIDTAIHMFGVFIDLGIIWINTAGEVVDKCLAKRWLTIKSPKQPARYILEIVPDRLHEFNIGDKIYFEESTSN